MTKPHLVAFILFLMPLGLHAEAMEATILGLRGTVSVTLPTAERVPAVAGMKLPVGSTIETAANSEVELRGLPNTSIKLAASSVLTVKALDLAAGTRQKTLLDLKNGSLNAALKNLDPAVTDFKVKTPLGVAAARGTIFNVTVSQDGKMVRVTVSEGVVGIIDAPGHEERIEVNEGQKIILKFTDEEGVTYEITIATFDELAAAGDFSIAVPEGFSQALKGGGGGGVSVEVTPVRNE